jgi:phosphoribosyl-dephospho-CoA transferase
MAGERSVAPRRHDRVWLGRGWEGALAAPLAPEARAAVAAWIEAGRPLVAARRDPGAPGAPAPVALGLARPPGVAPRRVAVAVAAAAVARIAPPLRLAEALRSAPGAWRAPLSALDDAARRSGLVLRVHGSLAWQHLSGERHVGPASDVDLLVVPRDGAALSRALALLRAREGELPRLDGEVILPGGDAVAWRELADGAERLLVKSATAVALRPRAAVLEVWSESPDGSRDPPSHPAERGERAGVRGVVREDPP